MNSGSALPPIAAPPASPQLASADGSEGYLIDVPRPRDADDATGDRENGELAELVEAARRRERRAAEEAEDARRAAHAAAVAASTLRGEAADVLALLDSAERGGAPRRWRPRGARHDAELSGRLRLVNLQLQEMEHTSAKAQARADRAEARRAVAARLLDDLEP